MEILRTDSTNSDFLMLVKLLDAELAERDGEDHEFYNSYNNVDTIKNAIVCKEEGIPIGCGGIKELEPGSMEVHTSRMQREGNCFNYFKRARGLGKRTWVPKMYFGNRKKTARGHQVIRKE